MSQTNRSAKIHAASADAYAGLLRRKGDQKFRTVNLVDVFREALRKADEFIPSESGAILLDDPATKVFDPRSREVNLSAVRLVVAACFGRGASELAGRSFAAAGALAGRSYLGRVTLVAAEPGEGPLFDAELDARVGGPPEGLLSTPLLVKGVAIGAIQLLNRAGSSRYSQRDREILEILADYIAINVQTALDAKTLEEISKRDYLTQLYNDWWFTLELQALVRGEQPFSLVFFDLDNFKEVNDTWGHLIGAETLIAIGRRVRDVLPTGSFAARFGGDEFEIALPGMPLAEATTVGEALRQAIERDLHREIEGRNVLEDLTCSVGVAYFDPERDPRDYRELMQRADAAMYEAKRLGKNRVVAEDRNGQPVGARPTLEVALSVGPDGVDTPNEDPYVPRHTRE